MQKFYKKGMFNSPIEDQKISLGYPRSLLLVNIKGYLPFYLVYAGDLYLLLSVILGISAKTQLLNRQNFSLPLLIPILGVHT